MKATMKPGKLPVLAVLIPLAVVLAFQKRNKNLLDVQDVQMVLNCARMFVAYKFYVFLLRFDLSFVFFRGVQTINLTVTNGGPLPFAYDILTAAFMYGNRVFTQYPPDIPDYFKQTFPEGYSWERTLEFEDGAKCLVESVIRLVKTKTCSTQYLLKVF